jgi:hypothetical protein
MKPLGKTNGEFTLLYIGVMASVVYCSEFLATERRCSVLPVRYELNLYMLCRRKWTASVV